MARDMRSKAQRTKGRDRRSQDVARPVSLDDYRAAKAERVEKVMDLKALNHNQGLYMGSIDSHTLTFGLGPAGTGKTFIAAWKMADAFDKGEIERIIVSRPAIEAGESLGFLPGELEEKVAPYFVPVREALEKRLGKGRVEYAIKAEQIVFVPLALMRGRTFDDAGVILDEAQNTTPKQMKMFLTRIGRNSHVIVNGDTRQSDIPGPNGLVDATHRLRTLPSVNFITFTRADVVRSGLAQQIVDAYEGTDDDNQPELPGFITGRK